MENERKVFLIYVAGSRYENSDGSSRIKYLLGLTNSDKLKLIREPDNPFDQYAIKVVYGNNFQIGYIPMEKSKIITEYLTQGYKYEIPKFSIIRADIGYRLSCEFKLIMIKE
ncbi:HIRAN domain-containing protein [uncultured Lutibacter sp.]|uniref:HIRAN domain-containing protein n=1 Tax=uncultured Lutibacter sp. TaxID=437739 RepID=UPI0026275E66|nr:HIRAN domain-containing protein [uncultured Lutibacter sp.]